MDGLDESLYGDEIYLWGRKAQGCRQGHAIRLLDRRFWAVSWSGIFDTIERDGKMRYEGDMWRSENDVFLCYPRSVMDDYGSLVPVPDA